jgi:hypothetical protein
MSGGQVAGNSGQHTVLPSDPDPEARERLDRPAASLVHAYVYAAVYADIVREDHSRSAWEAAEKAQRSANTAASLYRGTP